MPYRDIRAHLDELKRRELLHEITEPIGRDTELVSLVRLQFRGLPEPERKAFWFRNVTDAAGRRFDASVALGSLGSSRAVYGAALGVEPDHIAGIWKKAHGNPLPPRPVPRAGNPPERHGLLNC